MPDRSCIICKSKKNKNNLIRLVNKDGSLIFDLSQKIYQRGCYVCYKYECLSTLKKIKNYKKIGNFKFNEKENILKLEEYFQNRNNAEVTEIFSKYEKLYSQEI